MNPRDFGKLTAFAAVGLLLLIPAAGMAGQEACPAPSADAIKQQHQHARIMSHFADSIEKTGEAAQIDEMIRTHRSELATKQEVPKQLVAQIKALGLPYRPVGPAPAEVTQHMADVGIVAFIREAVIRTNSPQRSPDLFMVCPQCTSAEYWLAAFDGLMIGCGSGCAPCCVGAVGAYGGYITACSNCNGNGGGHCSTCE